MMLEELDLFRKDVGSFFRLYDFLSQIIDYGDTDSKMTDIYLTNEKTKAQLKLLGELVHENLPPKRAERSGLRQALAQEGWELVGAPEPGCGRAYPHRSRPRK